MKKEFNNVLVFMTIGTLAMNGCTSKKIVITDTTPQSTKQVVPPKAYPWGDIKHSSVLPIAETEPIPVEEEEVVPNKSVEVNKEDEDCKTCQVTVPLTGSKIVSIKRATFSSLSSTKKSKEVYSYENEVLMAKNAESIENSNPYKKSLETTYVENSKEREEIRYASVEKMDVPLLIDENIEEVRYASVEKTSPPIISLDKISPPTTIDNFSSETAIQLGAFREYAGAKQYAKKFDLLSSQYKVEIKEKIKNNQPLYKVRIAGFSNENDAKEFIDKYELAGAFLVRR